MVCNEKLENEFECVLETTYKGVAGAYFKTLFLFLFGGLRRSKTVKQSHNTPMKAQGGRGGMAPTQS
jgi:hypothetical protein